MAAQPYYLPYYTSFHLQQYPFMPHKLPDPSQVSPPLNFPNSQQPYRILKPPDPYPDLTQISQYPDPYFGYTFSQQINYPETSSNYPQYLVPNFEPPPASNFDTSLSLPTAGSPSLYPYTSYPVQNFQPQVHYSSQQLQSQSSPTPSHRQTFTLTPSDQPSYQENSSSSTTRHDVQLQLASSATCFQGVTVQAQPQLLPPPTQHLQTQSTPPFTQSVFDVDQGLFPHRGKSPFIAQFSCPEEHSSSYNCGDALLWSEIRDNGFPVESIGKMVKNEPILSDALLLFDELTVEVGESTNEHWLVDKHVNEGLSVLDDSDDPYNADEDEYEYEVKFRIDKIFSSWQPLIYYGKFSLFPNSSTKFVKKGVGEFEFHLSWQHVMVSLLCVNRIVLAGEIEEADHVLFSVHASNGLSELASENGDLKSHIAATTNSEFTTLPLAAPQIATTKVANLSPPCSLFLLSVGYITMSIQPYPTQLPPPPDPMDSKETKLAAKYEIREIEILTVESGVKSWTFRYQLSLNLLVLGNKFKLVENVHSMMLSRSVVQFVQYLSDEKGERDVDDFVWLEENGDVTTDDSGCFLIKDLTDREGKVPMSPSDRGYALNMGGNDVISRPAFQKKFSEDDLKVDRDLVSCNVFISLRDKCERFEKVIAVYRRTTEERIFQANKATIVSSLSAGSALKGLVLGKETHDHNRNEIGFRGALGRLSNHRGREAYEFLIAWLSIVLNEPISPHDFCRSGYFTVEADISRPDAFLADAIVVYIYLAKYKELAGTYIAQMAEYSNEDLLIGILRSGTELFATKLWIGLGHELKYEGDAMHTDMYPTSVGMLSYNTNYYVMYEIMRETCCWLENKESCNIFHCSFDVSSRDKPLPIGKTCATALSFRGHVWDPGTLRTRFVLKRAALLRSCHHDRSIGGLEERRIAQIVKI